MVNGEASDWCLSDAVVGPKICASNVAVTAVMAADHNRAVTRRAADGARCAGTAVTVPLVRGKARIGLRTVGVRGRIKSFHYAADGLAFHHAIGVVSPAVYSLFEPAEALSSSATNAPSS